MDNNEFYILPNHSGPTMAVGIDTELCIGCNSCASICRVQTILPNPERGKPPVVAYPDECWYCGCCVEACPTGALQMRLPINQRIFFKDKESGKVFRIGGNESPEKSFFMPPYGWLDGNELNSLWRAVERREKPIAAFIDPSAAYEIGKYFGEKERADNGGKIVHFLRAIGVSKIYLAGDVSDCGDALTIFVGPEPKKADFNLDVKQLSSMIYRGCVSRYTAIHLWRTMKSEAFDE